MNPRKIETLYPAIAQQNGVSEKMVEDLTNTYWKNLKKKWSSLSHFSIYASGICTFKLKYWRLDEDITEIENGMKPVKERFEQNLPVSYQKFAIFKEKEKDLISLKRIKEIANEELKEKAYKRKLRYEGYPKKSVAQQGENS